MQRRQFLTGLTALGISGYAGAQDQAAPPRGPDVIFVPTPDEIVDAMLRLAAVTAKDTVYDLGCGEATVVTLYLLTDLNLKLRPKLMKDLNPGTRVVSHAFNMGDWKPEKQESIRGTTVYLWRIPARTT
jgi:hypothetical protein